MTDESPLILVVDDETALTDLYATWLKSDYRVQTAYSGEEAVEQLDDEIDVILLDRQMPGLSGNEVLEEVRERDIDCHVSMVAAVEPNIEISTDTYLTKPISRDRLSETVETLLNQNPDEEGV